MQSKLNRTTALFMLGLSTMLLASCQPKVMMPTEIESAQTANDAYLAYERGDCNTVRQLTDPDSLEAWPFNEMRHSMLLLRGFCLEIGDDVDGARETYHELILEAPNSFASDDAAERIRVLKLIEDDPNFVDWTRAAKDRAKADAPQRTPIDRVPVEFPPLAKATGIDGYAVIEYGITGRGDIDNPVVVESNPPFLFDGVSLRAVRRWQYARSRSAGAISRHLIRIVFKRDGVVVPEAPLKPAESVEPDSSDTSEIQ